MLLASTAVLRLTKGKTLTKTLNRSTLYRFHNIAERPMNRIQIGPLATAVETHPETRTKLRTEPARQPREFQPSLFVPLHYEKNYAYPLIVWLHSNGDDQTQVLRIMPTLSLRNFVSVAPQASDGNNPCGFFWEQTVHGIEHAQAAVKDAINYAQIKLNIASHRIFLAGYGAGGTMAFRVGLQLSQIRESAITRPQSPITPAASEPGRP